MLHNWQTNLAYSQVSDRI